MAELDTIAIHSLKDSSKCWQINKADFDPSIHVPWDDEGPAQTFVAQISSQETEENDAKGDARTYQPSVPDFELDAKGEIIAVNVIDPRRPRARSTIPLDEYDPDRYQLWSTHPRFQGD